MIATANTISKEGSPVGRIAPAPGFELNSLDDRTLKSLRNKINEILLIRKTKPIVRIDRNKQIKLASPIQPEKRLEILELSDKAFQYLSRKGLGFRTTDQITKYTREELRKLMLGEDHNSLSLNTALARLKKPIILTEGEVVEILDNLEAKLAWKGLSLK